MVYSKDEIHNHVRIMKSGQGVFSVAIPPGVALEAGIAEGRRVERFIDGKRLAIHPARKYSIEGVTARYSRYIDAIMVCVGNRAIGSPDIKSATVLEYEVKDGRAGITIFLPDIKESVEAETVEIDPEKDW